MVDSQVVSHVISRMRSSSHQLNYVLQTCLGLSLFSGVQPLAMWIGTHENPADDPTRGKALRPPIPLSESANTAVQCIVKRHRWVYLVTKAQWLAKRKEWNANLGFPGEGPQQRQMPAVNLGRDLRVRVTAPTMKRYAARVGEFDVWLLSTGLGPLPSLVRDPEKLNAALLPYLQHLYNEGRPVSHGSWLLAGLQALHPQLCGRMQPSWQVQRQWNYLSPSETRTPLPVEVLLAIATCAWVKGLHRTATALLLGFHLLLRPSEIGEAKRGHLTLPCDTGGALDSGVFAVMRSKTASRTTLLQSVVIEDPKLLTLAEHVFGSDPPDCLWVRGGLLRLQRHFVQCKRALQLSSSSYTLGSLRAGGAVEFLRRTSNAAGLQVRGRWTTQKSMYHYTQMSLAAVAISRLPDDTRQTIFALAHMASTLLDPVMW
eukprot:2093188-Amphidinium_carterae.1